MTRRPRESSDAGVSMIYALVVIAVMSIVMAALLAFAESAIRTNSAMIAATERDAAIDGAAQIAVNAVRLGTYTGNTGGCFGATSTLTLSNYYTAADGSKSSAAVTCAADDTRVIHDSLAFSTANRPVNSILTLGTDPDGLSLDPGAGTMKVSGDIYSTSTIAQPGSAGSSLTVDGAATAEGDCTGAITADPLACDAPPTQARTDPDYPAPTVPDGITVYGEELPNCVPGTVYTMQPGLYIDASGLRRLTNCAATINAAPGVYFFDFDPAAGTNWILTGGVTFLGGDPTTPLVAGVPPTLPGACKSPTPPDPVGSWTPPPANDGVEFVFAGESHMEIQSAKVELCGSYSATSPPIVLYGLKDADGTVEAQSGCVIDPVTSCPVLNAVRYDPAYGADPPHPTSAQVYVEGTAYLPQNLVNIYLYNTGGGLFTAGIIARGLQVVADPGANLAVPIFSIPAYAPPGRLTVLYLTVYLCPGQATCSPSTGTRSLQAKIGVIDPTGLPVGGARQVSVYSWSAQNLLP